MSVWAELEGCCSLRNDVFAAACLFAGKKNSTWGNICQFEMLFVQFTLQRSGPNWPFFRGAMMEQSPALRAMTEAEDQGIENANGTPKGRVPDEAGVPQSGFGAGPHRGVPKHAQWQAAAVY